MAGSEGGDGGMLSPEDDDSADELSHLVDPYVTNCDASRVDTTRPSTFV